MTRNDANRIGGKAGAAPNGAAALIPAGTAGVIIDSPTDTQHAYKVHFNDAAEAMLRHTEFSVLKEMNADEPFVSTRLPKRPDCGWAN